DPFRLGPGALSWEVSRVVIGEEVVWVVKEAVWTANLGAKVVLGKVSDDGGERAARDTARSIFENSLDATEARAHVSGKDEAAEITRDGFVAARGDQLQQKLVFFLLKRE